MSRRVRWSSPPIRQPPSSRPAAGRRRHLAVAAPAEKLGGLDHRFRVKARAHDAVMKSVGDGDHGHGLMVRHEGTDDRERLALGQRAGVKSSASYKP